MDARELMGRVERILASARTAALATVDEAGRPHVRWMTPTVLKGRPGALYAVTSPHLAKVVQLAGNSQVEWMIQTAALNEVVHLRGRINVVDNPSLKAEIAEAIGGRLTAFWKVSAEHTDFVVLETAVEEGVYFLPMKGSREIVSFA